MGRWTKIRTRYCDVRQNTRVSTNNRIGSGDAEKRFPQAVEIQSTDRRLATKLYVERTKQSDIST